MTRSAFAPEPALFVTGAVSYLSFDSHDVYRDVAQTIYSIDWSDADLDGDATSAGDVLAPVCCTADEDVEIAYVALAYPQQISTTNAQIKGYVGGQEEFTGTNLSETQLANGWWQYASDDVTGSITAPSTIEVVNTTITWKIVYTTSLTEHPAGTTSNDIYFVLRDPPTSWKLLYTVLDIACIGGEGLDLDDSDLIAEGIIGIFEELNVTRAEDDAELEYYGSWTVPYNEFDELVKEGDGNCVAWVDLYVKCLLAAGLGDPDSDGAINTIQFGYNKIVPEVTAWMFVKDWNPAQSRTPDQYDDDFPDEDDAFPHLNIPILTFDPTNPTSFYMNDQYNWHANVADFTDEDGDAGQNELDPQSLFTDHFVVRYGEVLFDPSYGKRYDIPQGATGNDILEPIDAAMDGYGLGYLLSVKLSLPTKCFIIMENPDENQLKAEEPVPQPR